MYTGHLAHLTFLSYLSPKLQSVIEIAKDKLSTPIENGKYELFGESAFMMVVEDQTRPLENRRSEIHRNYLDVQILLEGEEVFGYSLNPFTAIEEDLLADKDVAFSEQLVDEKFIKVGAGEFIVFYPGQPHRPLVATESGPASVRKAIIKVHKDFL
ncbi:YhcH/YjgK/YiaL family protein [Vibrio owensii]|uniref:YhcH/YjgK/YiaL family protein n=1 Tax=Vibrio owensii TaxID=696485 RepID=UPI002F3FF410